MANNLAEMNTEVLSANTKLTVTPCGDGLYYFGGDILCTYPLLGTEFTETSVRLEYEKYYITVSWTNVDADGNKRTNPKWERTYK